MDSARSAISEVSLFNAVTYRTATTCLPADFVPFWNIPSRQTHFDSGRRSTKINADKTNCLSAFIRVHRRLNMLFRNRLDPDLLQRHVPLAHFAVRRVRVISRVQLRQIVQRQIAEIVRVRRRLINNHRQPDYRRPARFQQPLQLIQLLSRPQDVVHNHHLLARMLLQVLPEVQRFLVVLPLRPVHLLGAQGFRHAVRHRQPTRHRDHNRKLRHNRADFRVGSQQAAQPDTQHALILVVAHGQRHLQVLVGVQPARILEVAVAQRAGLPQHRDHFFLRRNDVHRLSPATQLDRVAPYNRAGPRRRRGYPLGRRPAKGLNSPRGRSARGGWSVTESSSLAPATSCRCTTCPSSSRCRSPRCPAPRWPTNTSAPDASAAAAAATAYTAPPRSAPPDAVPPATYRRAARSTTAATRRPKTSASTARSRSIADHRES